MVLFQLNSLGLLQILKSMHLSYNVTLACSNYLGPLFHRVPSRPRMLWRVDELVQVIKNRSIHGSPSGCERQIRCCEDQ